MPLWLQVAFCIVCTIQIPFAAWIVCKILYLQTALAGLRGRVASREHECTQRLEWLRGLDTKIDTLNTNVSEIIGYLKAKDIG